MMPEKEELKPCPFCGRPAEMDTYKLEDGRYFSYAYCPYDDNWFEGKEPCLVRPETELFDSKSALLKAWNKRPDNDKT